MRSEPHPPSSCPQLCLHGLSTSSTMTYDVALLQPPNFQLRSFLVPEYSRYGQVIRSLWRALSLKCNGKCVATATLSSRSISFWIVVVTAGLSESAWIATSRGHQLQFLLDLAGGQRGQFRGD
ncbi:hypothetical protein N657DRAFT_465149 [Parathielavia appendiculata]|uniref:Uncharacterized protein n=1 Tax=Parathielavia appendiculata TaxID=2587402 RepID=A0AAN6TPX7_9PEZI|nr:hypothetical protein N657DRAFT_465149 [Parathielavia appendiculata]